MEIVFSQASIFHLYRLGLIVTGKTGKKFRLSDSEQMYSLIRFCDRSQDPSINRQFDAFIDSVEPNVRAQMQASWLLRAEPRAASA